jgi:hypothetical protein
VRSLQIKLLSLLKNREDASFMDTEPIETYDRYCDFSIIEIENILFGHLHFSLVSSFNDPRDSRISCFIDLNPNDTERRKFLDLGLSEELCKTLKFKIAKKIEDSICVCCFTKADLKDRPTMWGYYANKSSGMKISYRSPQLRSSSSLAIEEKLLEVTYGDDKNLMKSHSDSLFLSILSRMVKPSEGPNDIEEALLRQVPVCLGECGKSTDADGYDDLKYVITTKAKCWEKEKEFRLVRILTKGKKQVLALGSGNRISEICLGARSSAENIAMAKALFSGKKFPLSKETLSDSLMETLVYSAQTEGGNQ